MKSAPRAPPFIPQQNNGLVRNRTRIQRTSVKTVLISVVKMLPAIATIIMDSSVPLLRSPDFADFPLDSQVSGLFNVARFLRLRVLVNVEEGRNEGRKFIS